MSKHGSVALLSCLLSIAAWPPATAAPQSAADAAAEVRQLVRDLDPHTAARLGERALAEHPDALELRAWWTIALARGGRASEALESARDLVDSHPDDGASWLALAAAQMEDREESAQAFEASARALRILGDDHPDALWLHAQALIEASRYDEAVDLTNREWSDRALAAAMWRQRARALYYLSAGRQPDPERRAEAEAAARRAVELAPDSAATVVGLGSLLDIFGKTDEAVELIARAERLSPGSIPIRQRVWQGLVRRTDLTAEEKLARLRADIDDLLRRHERSAPALQAAHVALRTMDAADLRRSLGDEILAEYPDSPEAEGIAVGRYREIRGELFGQLERARQENPDVEPQPDPDLVARFRKALHAFLSRGHFHRQLLRGDAYRELFSVSEFGEPASPEELLEIVNGMAAYEGINTHVSHAAGPIALAERTTYYDRAEEIVREGFDLAEERLGRQRSFYDTQAEFDETRDWMQAILHDALGWIYFQSDRIDRAKEELERAHQLDPDSIDNLHHLGQLAEHEADRTAAERYYTLGLNVARPGVNPNRASLEALYRHDHGSLEGFDAYLERIADADAQARHEEILESRIAEPEPAAPFALRTLDGETRTLEQLRGKIAVVNFWGIWCYWCVVEMPEMQQLHERYADDPEVVILTINNDPNPDQVPGWMQKQGYTFPVLLDDGYVDQQGISVFPTTWFLDPRGRMAFVKRSWSQELLQEYAWRIEAIREEARSRSR